jgi:hypothetical protein
LLFDDGAKVAVERPDSSVLRMTRGETLDGKK